MVQTFAAKKVMNFLSENIQSEFSVADIHITFFNEIVINHLYIEDLVGDTLLNADKLTVSISRPRFKQRILKIQKIELDHSYINFYIDSTRTINLKFLIERLSKKDRERDSKWDIEVKNIKINDSRFYLARSGAKVKEYGINFGNLKLYNLNADLRKFKPDGDTVNFVIGFLSFTEGSGFILNDFSSRTSICKNHLKFEDITIQTPLSSVSGDRVNLFFGKFTDFKIANLYTAVRLDIHIDASSVNLYDLSFYVPVFRDSYQSVNLSGTFSGPVNNFAGEKIVVSFGKYSFLSGEFDLDGLPDIDETFIFARFSKVQTNVSELEELTLPGERQLNFPDFLSMMGTFTYTGQFTGFYNDFVAYGTMRSDLGFVKTDLLLRPDKHNNLVFNGKIQTRDFRLGKLLDNEKNFGDITFEVVADGSMESGRSLSAEIQGELESLEFKKYIYKSIRLSGLLQNKKYNGEVFVKDPNVTFDFRGMVDFASDTPRYDFIASVTRANLYSLNIDRSDPDQEVSFDIVADARGNSLNNINGNIKLINALFSKKDNQIQIYDLYASASNNHVSNSFIIRSDFLDADLSGKYQIDKIRESLNKFLYSYLPTLADSGRCLAEDFKSEFQFNVSFKHTKPIFEYFLPDYLISENTFIEGVFEPDTNRFYLHAQSPLLRYKGNEWKNFNLNIESGDSIFSLSSGSEILTIAEVIDLENFSIYTDASSDTLNLLVRWNNWDSSLYRGTLDARLHFRSDSVSSFPSVFVDLSPTRIVTYDTVWKIDESGIIIRDKKITFNDLFISHNDQYFRIDGTISENPFDNLAFEFHDFNIENLNNLIFSRGISIEGILNGSAKVSNIFTNPVFYSELQIDTLEINNEILGNTLIHSSWNNSSKSVLLNAYAKRGLLKTFAIDGEYFPKERGIVDFDIELNKLRLNLFNPYAKSVANDLKGLATGNMKLTGNIREPVLSGEIFLQKASFTINYLKTRYNFTSKIGIDGNNIFFNNMQVFDQYGNSSVLNGSVTNKYFRDFRLNLSINAKNFQFLNTTHADNSQFYGTAFASGLVMIRGKPENITMDVNAKTEKDTRLFIPLSNPEEITEYNFVNLIMPDQENDENHKEQNYRVDLSGIQLNFDLEVTPEAEVQMIFDPVVGDILKGRGSGDLKLQINTLGKFNMYGNYTVEEGEYLFTLLNVINRKFLIEYGGTINWNGAPLDATIDLKAIYRTKASLNDLLGATFDGTASKTTVDCQILMTGKLMSPNIDYEIYLPNVEETTRERVRNAINTSDEKNKQFSSLLVLNSFMPKEQGGAFGFGSSSPYTNVAGANASEFLSNQLSHWLSQISSEVDLELNYRTDRTLKSDEVEVAMSTQLLNDRLTTYGNLGVPTNAAAQASNNIVGDVDIDYKITKSGKLRVKAFNHSNEDQIYLLSPYTQGVGLVYKEEFNTFGELFRRYWKAIVGDVEKKKSKPVSSVN
ncbi:MAG: translocation/assembly module TamB [Bacteroidales bacterium]|nr:translocation/assembly module TamB [Bacteroidales bacterium]